MKDAIVTGIDDALLRIDRWDALLDARSPSEYAEDHLPRAINAPVLDDAERVRVGTLYKQEGAFEAKRVGAALVSRNIASIIETQLADTARDWQPLVYCWRGGNRSGALATVLARIGWRVSVLQGGYREFRRRVLADLEHSPLALDLRVVAGRTGSGKSLILERLRALGAQVLDLEQLAAHRGSVLGHLPGQRQPSQKAFETSVWNEIRRLDTSRPVFVESESRKIGACQVPAALIVRMRASACVRVEAATQVRAALLLSEYRHFVDSPQHLSERMRALVPLHGHERIEQWMRMADAGLWEDFVVALLEQHYDPAYDRSMERNFARLDTCASVSLTDCGEQAIDTAAREMIGIVDANPLQGPTLG